MCEPGPQLKLCTCDGETLENPDWVLSRLDPSIPPEHRKGKVMRRPYDADEQTIILQIITELDSATSVDFDYTPQANDVLSLKLRDDRYRFRFVDDHWTHDRSTSLTPWRSQMRQHLAGEYGG